MTCDECNRPRRFEWASFAGFALFVLGYSADQALSVYRKRGGSIESGICFANKLSAEYPHIVSKLIERGR